MAGSSSTLQTITKLTWHRHVFHTCTQHFKTIGAMADLKSFLSSFILFFTSCHCEKKKKLTKYMLPTLWVLETFLFPISNKANIPTFRHVGLMRSKCHSFEIDNFEACSVRPPVLSLSLSCRDPFCKRFNSGLGMTSHLSLGLPSLANISSPTSAQNQPKMPEN